MLGIASTLKRKPNKLLGGIVHKPNQMAYRVAYHNGSVCLCAKLGGYWFRLSMRQWSLHMETPYNTLYTRLKMGMSHDKCVGLVDRLDEYHNVTKPAKQYTGEIKCLS